MKKISLFILVLFSCNSQESIPRIVNQPDVIVRFENLFHGREQISASNELHKEEVFPGIYWVKRTIANYEEAFGGEVNCQTIHLVVVDAEKYKIRAGILGWNSKIEKLAKTSKIAREKKALVAVNGGFFSPPNYSYSLLIIDGRKYSYNSRERGVLGVTSKNELIIKKISPKTNWTGVEYAMGGWGVLVREGKPVYHDVKKNNESLKEWANERHPRTAVGFSSDQRYLYFLTVDGRQAGYSIGLGLDDLTDLAWKLGVNEALNLDGGGSTTLYIKGKGVVNSPSDVDGERDVLSILYVK